MRLALVLVALSYAIELQADQPTTMLVRNFTASQTRVQVALGGVLPCDSPDNRLMFDGVIEPGGKREIRLDQAMIACVRNTTAGNNQLATVDLATRRLSLRECTTLTVLARWKRSDHFRHSLSAESASLKFCVR